MMSLLFAGRPFVVCTEQQFNWLMDEFERVGLPLDKFIVVSMSVQFRYRDRMLHFVAEEALVFAANQIKSAQNTVRTKWYHNTIWVRIVLWTIWALLMLSSYL